MNPPAIGHSTIEERRQFVEEQWACQHNCELCGHCNMLHGKSADEAYADYIAGKRSYMDVTISIREMMMRQMVDENVEVARN